MNFFSLHKYFIQADIMKHNLFGEPFDNNTEYEYSSRIVTYNDLWLANLHTVLCGIKEQKPDYDKLANLIIPEHIEKLKQYRDSTFHFEFYSDRSKRIKILDRNWINWIFEIYDTLSYHFLLEMQVAQSNKNEWPKNEFCKIKHDKRNSCHKIPKSRLLYGQKKHWEFIHLCQYFKRAILMKAHFHRELNKNSEFFVQNTYMGAWYSLICCVIEGYQKLQLSENSINNLLESDNLAALYKYRHSFTGYHKDYFNTHLITDFIINHRSAVWINNLHNSFRNYFRSECYKNYIKLESKI